MRTKTTVSQGQSFEAVDVDYVPGCADSERAQSVCRQLEVAGVEPLLLRQDHRICASVASLSVNASTALASNAAIAQLRDQVFALLSSGLTLSVAVTGLGVAPAAGVALRRLCEVLSTAAQETCTNPAAIELAVEIAALAPQDSWLIRREILGEGLVYIVADGETMNPAGRPRIREHSDRFWLQLWHLRDTSMLRAAHASIVSPQSPLLADEIATGVLPGAGVQVPTGTAWVPMRLNLARFADANGHVQEAALEDALHSCVDLGDVLHDLMCWPTATMRHDAWLNRRLAITVTGLGDLAACRGLDPRKFQCLETLNELLRWLQQTLRDRSRQIAGRTNCLPALDLCDPSLAMPGGCVRDDWRQRWRRAVDQGAVRHRNLLVLSPWSVFPANQPADMRYADLLPLVAYADACAFGRSASLSHWNVNEFRGFHQRGWAVLQQRDAAALIAERV